MERLVPSSTAVEEAPLNDKSVRFYITLVLHSRGPEVQYFAFVVETTDTTAVVSTSATVYAFVAATIKICVGSVQLRRS